MVRRFYICWRNFTFSIDNRGPLTRFNFIFAIGLHIDDEPLLLFIRDRLGCGKVSTYKDKALSYFFISDTSDLKSIFLPIMDRFPLNTTKYLDYLDFKEALLLEKPKNTKTKLLSQEYVEKKVKLKRIKIEQILIYLWII